MLKIMMTTTMMTRRRNLIWGKFISPRRKGEGVRPLCALPNACFAIVIVIIFVIVIANIVVIVIKIIGIIFLFLTIPSTTMIVWAPWVAILLSKTNAMSK